MSRLTKARDAQNVARRRYLAELVRQADNGRSCPDMGTELGVSGARVRKLVAEGRALAEAEKREGAK